MSLSERLLLVAGLALGAWCRFSGIGVGWFMVDQVRDAGVATSLAAGTSFPLSGPASAQSTLDLSGPFYYYLIAIPYGISRDPYVALSCSILLSTFSLYLLFKLGTEMLGTKAG